MADTVLTAEDIAAMKPVAPVTPGLSPDDIAGMKPVASAGLMPEDIKGMRPYFAPQPDRFYAQDPDQIFPQPAAIKTRQDVALAANAIEGKYQYMLAHSGDNADMAADAASKRDAELADLSRKAQAAKLPFKELKTGGEVVDEALAKEVDAARMSPEDVQALLPGKLPGGIVPAPGLAARAIAPIESGVATTAGGVANPQNIIYAAGGEPMIPGFVAQQVAQGAADIAGGAKKIISGQPGGGEEATEGVLGLGMAAAPAVLAKVLPARSTETAAPAARPADDWLPPATKPAAVTAAPQGGEINNERIQTTGEQVSQTQGSDQSGSLSGLHREGEIRSEGDGTQGESGNGQGTPPPREENVPPLAPGGAATIAKAVPEETPAAIPVGDGKAADAGTGAEMAAKPSVGTAVPQAETPPPSGQAPPGNVAPGATAEPAGRVDVAAVAAPPATMEAPASSGLAAPVPVEPSGFIAGSAAEKWADKTIAAGQIRSFSGLDPELMVAYAIKGGALIEKGLREFGAWSGEMVKQFGDAVRPHLQNLWQQAQQVAAGPTRQFAEQLQDSKDISDALKGGVTNTTYTRRGQEEDSAYANRILQDVGGPDQARAVFNDQSRLPAPVRMALGMQILKAFDDAGRHADAASFFDNDFAQHTTDVAQGLAMLNAWHSMSKAGKIFWAQKKISDAARDAVAPVKPDIDAAKTELQRQNASGIEKATGDAQVQGAAKDAITDAVTNSKETHAGVVMELAQPWASSPEILGMARAAVRAKADELLNRAPRPPGFTPAQHLRQILDDLAKRAADIAAGHYQGAEPGVTLTDKLQQRLGLSKDAAQRLANSLDKEFERQVEAAKKKLVRAGLAKAAARGKAKAAVGRMSNADAKSRSVPDREAEAAAKNLTDAATAGPSAGVRPGAIQEFYQRLTAQLRQLLPAAGAAAAKMTDLQRIAEAFSNPEKFEEVWARLGTELRAKYGIEGMADVQNTLGKLTPEGLMETQLDRSIRQQLTDAKVKIGQLVREHYTKADATKADMADKLVKQAGLDGDAARRLADAIKSRFEAMTKDAKRAALERLLKPVKRLGLAKPQMVDRLVQLSNLGAFDDPTFYNAIKERMNLPEWTPALRDQLNGLADKIGKIPVDRIEDAQRAQTEFLNALERAKGISNLELGMAFYLQNILSGLTTHVRVAIHTSLQMAVAIEAEMSRALAGDRLEDIPLMFEALARGGGRALNQMKEIFRSGMIVGSKVKRAEPQSALELTRFGEKGGTTFRQGAIAKALLENRAAKILNLWKYNARLITAQHMLYFAPAEEMKVALLASRQARTEGLTGRAAVNRARQMLGYGAGAVRAAEAQAVREGLEPGSTRAKMRVGEILKAGLPATMKETARDYALRQTFLSDPYGFIGALANSVSNMKASENPMLSTAARVIVPFARIAANIFNEGLNYTPYGALRAKGWNLGGGGLFDRTSLLGHKFADITPEVRSDLQKELYAKSFLGTILLTGIAFKAAQGLNQPNPGFTVYGQGPNNPQDQAGWRAAGGIPFSIKVGNRYVSYANTPANVMLAALGNYLDGVRDAVLYKRPGATRLAQNLPMRLAAATVGMGRVVLEQPFLSALVELFKTSSEPNPEVSGRGAAKIVARTASSFVVPNLLRQVDRFYDPTVYSQQDLGGILTSQIPFVRQGGQPMLNALGQPLKGPVFGLFTGTRTADPLVQTLVDHNAWPQLPDRNRTLVNGVPLTDDEFYTYCKARGAALTTMLGKPATAAELDRLAQQRDAIQARAQVAPNPVVKAKLQQLAAGLQNKVLEKYDAAANKQAEAAVVRMRGY